MFQDFLTFIQEIKRRAEDPGRQRNDFGVLNSWAGNRGGGLVLARENEKRLQNVGATKSERPALRVIPLRSWFGSRWAGDFW